MCQYSVNFDKCLLDVTDYLSQDPKLKLLGAIGKFHLADHVDSCFSKWTLNFMDGAGHIDGEIMETLWSSALKSGPVPVLDPSGLEPWTSLVLGTSKFQKKGTGTGKNRFGLVQTSYGINVVKRGLKHQSPQNICRKEL